MIECGVMTVDVEEAVAFEARAGGFFDVRPDDVARSVDAICDGANGGQAMGDANIARHDLQKQRLAHNRGALC